MYDSEEDTMDHIKKVQNYLNIIIGDLTRRSLVHDQSKLEPPEKETYDIYTPKLKSVTYGSEEYKIMMIEMHGALAHHYANNDHHPEFYRDGIQDMNLLALMEMLCDWKAATLRHADGNIKRSIEINQKRFGYSDELKQILLNTISLLK